jgi:hypothetical protein
LLVHRGNLVTALREKYFSEAELSARDLKDGSQMKYMRLMPKHGNPLIPVVFLLYWLSGSIEY